MAMSEANAAAGSARIREAARALSFRAATSADIPELCRLFAEVFGATMTPAIWRWKYHGMPGSDAVNVVGCDHEGRIRAHMGAQVFPGELVQGSSMPWMHGCDALVAKDARGSSGRNGAFGGVVRHLQGQIDARYPNGVCYGFPGERPFLLGERLGFYRSLHRIHLAELETDSPTFPRAYRWRRIHCEAHVESLAELNLGAGRPGVARTEDYLRWRFDRHPIRDYSAWIWRAGWRRWEAVVVEKQRDTWTIVECLGVSSLPGRVLGQLARAAREAGCIRLRWDAAWTTSDLTGAMRQATGIVAVWIRTPGDAGTPPGTIMQPADTDVF